LLLLLLRYLVSEKLKVLVSKEIRGRTVIVDQPGLDYCSGVYIIHDHSTFLHRSGDMRWKVESPGNRLYKRVNKLKHKVKEWMLPLKAICASLRRS
jgi:hypothetical protein